MSRQIRGFKGYIVKSDGTILGLSGQPLKPKASKYLKVDLYSGGKPVTKSIHRLVAIAFVPNPDNKPQVNHKNGIKWDNRASNLEWVTNGENGKHSYKMGRRISGFALTIKRLGFYATKIN